MSHQPSKSNEDLIEEFSEEYKKIAASYSFRNPTGQEIFNWAKQRFAEALEAKDAEWQQHEQEMYEALDAEHQLQLAAKDAEREKAVEEAYRKGYEQGRYDEATAFDEVMSQPITTNQSPTGDTTN